MTRGSRMVSQKKPQPSLKDLTGSVSSGTRTIASRYSTVNAIVVRNPGRLERRKERIVTERPPRRETHGMLKRLLGPGW